MIRDSGPQQDPVSAAVFELRRALGETQEQFARRLKTTIRTIARWEGDRPPTGQALARLLAIAAEHNWPHLVKVFQGRLEELVENMLGRVESAGEFYVLILTKPAEIAPVHALVEALRNPRYGAIAAKAARILKPVMEGIQRPIEEARRARRLGEAALAAYRAGKTDQEISEFLGVPIKRVREWKRSLEQD